MLSVVVSGRLDDSSLVEGSGVVDAASVGVDSDSVVVTSALVGMIEDLLSGSAIVAS